jgi:hypothetical protein
MILGWLIYALWLGCCGAWADTTLVPLPVITRPNRHETYTALLALLNKQDGALRSLLGPQVTWNSLLGASGSAYYQYLLTPDETYSFYASQSTGNQADYAVNYANVDLAQQRYRFEGRLEYSNDRSRFFGWDRTVVKRTRRTIHYAKWRDASRLDGVSYHLVLSQPDASAM